MPEEDAQSDDHGPAVLCGLEETTHVSVSLSHSLSLTSQGGSLQELMRRARSGETILTA